MNFPYATHIPYTLSLLANIGRDAALGTIRRGFVAEFDCELTVEYEDAENWEITDVRFEQTRFAGEFVVSAESDPDLWKLIKRGFDYDWKDLSDKIRECVVNAWEDRRSERGEWLRDMQMGR